MATPIDALVAQYNLSPGAAAALASQYANPLRYPNGELIEQPAAPPTNVPPPVVDGTTRWPNGELRSVNDPPPPPVDPNASAPAEQSTLNYTPVVPQVSQGPITVPPIRPGEPGSGSHIVPNPDRVASPYGGFDQSAAPASDVPVKVADAGWSHHTRGEQVTRGWDPEGLAAVKAQSDKVLAADESAMQSGQKLAVQKAADDAAYKSSYADEMQKYADRSKINEDNKRAFVDDQTKKLTAFTSKISQNENPDAVWGEGAGAVIAKIGAALAMGVGAFGTAFTHGPNFAKEIIDGEINRSIQAQRENVSNAKSGFDAQSNLYQKGLKDFGDRDQANLAARITLTNAALAEIDKVSAQSGLSDAQNAAMQTIRAQYEKENLDYVTRYQTLAQSHYVNSYQDKYLPAQYAGGPGKKKGKEQEQYLVPGYGVAQSKEDAAVLNKQFSAASEIDAGLAKIAKLQEEAKSLGSGGALNPTETSALGAKIDEIKRIKSQLVESKARSMGMRSVSPEALKLFAESMGIEGAEDLRGRSTQQIDIKKQAIREAQLRERQRTEHTARQYGLDSGGRVYYIGPDGKPHPAVRLEGRTNQPQRRQGDVGDVADDIEPGEPE
jgi:hypothetical protein